MIRNKKNLLILLIITLTFFTGINVVNAEDQVDLQCVYRLPFSAINPSTGKYFKEYSDFKCFDESNDEYSRDCYIEAVISSTAAVKKGSIGTGTGYKTYNFLNSYKKPKGYNGDQGNQKLVAYFLDNNNYTASYMLLGATADGINGKCDTEEWTYYPPSGGGGSKKSGVGHIIDVFKNHDCYDDATTATGGLYIKSDTAVCPKYIVVNKINFKDSQGNVGTNKNRSTLASSYLRDLRSVESFSNYDDFFPSNYIAYQTSSSDENFKNYLKNFYNIKITKEDSVGFWVNNNDLFEYNGVILPLYNSQGDKADKDQNRKNVKSAIKSYKDVVADAWVDTTSKYVNEMRTNCGNDWAKYINLNNYKEYFDGSNGGRSKKFVSYAQGGIKSARKDFDKNMSDECWNSRRRFMNMYKSFRVWMYAIGIETDGSSKETDTGDTPKGDTIGDKFITIFGSDTTKYGSDNDVYDWRTLKRIFENVRYGSTEDDINKGSTGNKDNDEQVKNSEDYSTCEYAYNTMYNDVCSYRCFTNIKSKEDITKHDKKWYEDKYSNCKSYDGSYKKCQDQLKTCGLKASLLSNICSDTNTTAYEECKKNYETKLSDTNFGTCMDEVVSDFSSTSESRRVMASDCREDAKKAYDEKATAITTYSFKDVGLLTFKFGTKRYEPKCKDVEFLTSIWGVLIVLAPFLLIIYSTFDYFRVVMAGDEEKMKLAKKKIPKRVIALVILLVFPQILRMLVTTFGTHRSNNTKYIQCILTGDKGENEETDEEDEEVEDDNN